MTGVGTQPGGEVVLAGVVGRAEGRLRTDLLHAALHQPLPVLEEQAVGELYDRIDDDPRQSCCRGRSSPRRAPCSWRAGT